MDIVKCEFCDQENGDKCVFATVKRVIDGKEHFFCSERHADAYEKKRELEIKKTGEDRG